MEKTAFGTTKDGTAVDLYTLTNANGMIAKIITYGGIVTELHVPTGAGTLADVVLGFDTLEGYLGAHPYFGAIVGRVGNRIAKGRFTLDGETYTLADQQRPEPPARRPQGLRQGGLEGRGRAGGGRRRAEAHVPQPGRRGRLSGQPRRPRWSTR